MHPTVTFGTVTPDLWQPAHLTFAATRIYLAPVSQHAKAKPPLPSRRLRRRRFSPCCVGPVALQELRKATGWQAHSVRGFLSGVVKKMDLRVDSTRREDGECSYGMAGRLVPQDHAQCFPQGPACGVTPACAWSWAHCHHCRASSTFLRETFSETGPYRYAILDHDSKFDGDVIAFLTATGLQATRTSIQAPWQNGIAQRWVGSCRREILDHVRVLNERHLRRLVQDYVNYHHQDRTHDSQQGHAEPAARRKPTFAGRESDLQYADRRSSPSV